MSNYGYEVKCLVEAKLDGICDCQACVKAFEKAEIEYHTTCTRHPTCPCYRCEEMRYELERQIQYENAERERFDDWLELNREVDPRYYDEGMTFEEYFGD